MTRQVSIPFDFQPVVIIGAARSGTNMLRDALVQLDGVATWPCDEINYIWRHGWARWPTDELLPGHATLHVRRYVRSHFRKLAHSTGARWIVEKTCANSLRVDFVRAVLPEAKFVFLLRDGRDVVASALKRWTAKLDLRYVLRKTRYVPLGDVPYYALRYLSHRLHRILSRERRLGSWGPRFNGLDEMLASCSLAEVCADQWRRSVAIAAEALARLPSQQVCRVRYEELVDQPTVELSRIARFLTVPTRPQQLDAVASSIRADRIGKWRTDLDAATMAAVKDRIQSTLHHWGYTAQPLAA